ncbi:MAG: DUF642 domain-containing protein, partial [Planctomycetaceae bacterium]|nr:DUF642 domain-containing protein [Planctomycetaceae bacterium]
WSTGVTLSGGLGDGALVLGQDQDTVLGGFNTTQQFRGTLYDVRVWNKVRSAAEISLNYQQKFDSGSLPGGLIANWQMDGFNGSNEVVDVVSGNNLSIGHAAGAGFIASTPVEDLHISENVVNGTTVGFVVPSDPDVSHDVATDGQFQKQSGLTSGSYNAFINGQTIGDWTVSGSSVQVAVGDGVYGFPPPLGGNLVHLASADSAIETTLTTTVGRQYQVVFAYGGDWADGVRDHFSTRVSAGGTSGDFALEKPAGWDFTNNMLWEHRSFTFTADSASTQLQFASLETVAGDNAVLANVQVIEIPAAVTTILNNDPTLSYDAGTRKFYKAINSASNFATALSTATSSTLNGAHGQLVTIGSQYENGLVTEIVKNSGLVWVWLGASDATVEGEWRWLEGASEGEQFWSGNGSGSTVNGAFAEWGSGEPNNGSGGTEDHAFINTTGMWNDTPAFSTPNLIIEWDASQVLSNFTFSLTDNAGGRFAIDSGTGEITVANATLIDYDTATSHNVTVEVTDATGNTYSQVMAITVDDAREATQTVPGSQNVSEEQVLTFSTGNGNAVSVSDTMASTNSTMQVSISVNDGVLTLSQTTGLTFVQGMQGGSSFVINGTESDLNAALQGMTFTPNANYSGAVTLNMQTSLARDQEGFYTFEGGNANDQSPGTANNGTLNGTATTTIDGTRGEVLLLDGAIGTDVQITGEFAQPASITAAAWVNSNTGYSEVISMSGRFAIRVDDPNTGGFVTGFYHDGTTYQKVISDVRIAGDGWHHLALSFDDPSKTLTLYIDGTVSAQSTFTNSIAYLGGNTYLGSNNGASLFLNGKIDDARIFSRALSVDEIAELAADATEAFDTVAITVDPINDAPAFHSHSGVTSFNPAFNFIEGNDTYQLDSGKFLVAGTVNGGASGNNFALARYNADGTLDTSFGTAGLATTDFSATSDVANALTVDANEKIIVVGSTVVGAYNDIAVARYNADGSLDTTFDTDGKVIHNIGFSDHGLDVAMDGNGRIVIAGDRGNGGNADPVVIRLNANGSLDGSFN